jgi:hypothetical protein
MYCGLGQAFDSFVSEWRRVNLFYVRIAIEGLNAIGTSGSAEPSD